ncbi:hypothetical protein GCM10010531_20820 [Blastococcus jejuensis]|uniref:Hemerythrin-like domain-containing protein n=1 Tax=Blastococcus jejuensis TaxID=351224 RepID=A0ABP6P5H8_9ACTN
MTATPTPHRAGQLMLPGQAAAPDGPVDLTTMFTMHRGFRRDLENFSRAVPATPVDDGDTWTALAARWDVFSRILHDHHSGEDAGLWPLLLERVDTAGDVEGRATLEAMSAEHGRIDPLLEACAAGFRRMARSPDAGGRDVLASDLTAAAEHLGAHLAHEERDALALVQRHLTQEEWLRVSVEYFEKPLTARQLLRVAQWVLPGLPDAALDRMRAEPKVPMLILVWRLFLRRPFERRERRAFRYAR